MVVILSRAQWPGGVEKIALMIRGTWLSAFIKNASIKGNQCPDNNRFELSKTSSDDDDENNQSGNRNGHKHKDVDVDVDVVVDEDNSMAMSGRGQVDGKSA